MWMEMQRKDIERGLLCGKLERLLSFDDSNMEKYKRISFDEFEEMMITWGATYMFNVGSHVFNTSHKIQLLACCDIVLFSRNDPTQIGYCSLIYGVVCNRTIWFKINNSNTSQVNET
ncbi:MAG: hypothetical protein EZS28_042471 [Streblomastix strix]|uniref:Inositol polyphosphate-related phosphatase domain-containing protein n=1 Tax=Streblomastix strix TaxID=222440 RepID=A0A5J4TVU1_9EUKA|nr:MAG: hypothetical protein EZS28_042471 [Streblomastix strix]